MSEWLPDFWTIKSQGDALTVEFPLFSSSAWNGVSGSVLSDDDDDDDDDDGGDDDHQNKDRDEKMGTSSRIVN